LTALWLAVAPAHSEELYSLDQRFGSIEFSVRHLGLFSSHGEFRRFAANLAFDRNYPEHTRISVDVDARSVDMPWQDGAEKLRSAAYFDVRDYPDIRFTSTAVVPETPDTYTIRGRLEIRGVTQPWTLHAKLVGRGVDSARDANIADFVVTGHLKRSAFSMTADPLFISDDVKIIIRARIQLDGTAHVG
jgi:polyisoprenoid-binding protein YceI